MPADGQRCNYCWNVSEHSACSHCPQDCWLDGVRSAYQHQGLARRAVLKLKYSGLFAAAEEMSQAVVEVLGRRTGGADVVLPVPLHRSRQRSRGFNQAEKLAAGYATRIGLPLRTDLLRRVRHTKPQAAGLSYRQRLDNVADAFRASPEVDGLSLILVDDVVTTTATTQACAAALKAAGAPRVYAVSFTRE